MGGLLVVLLVMGFVLVKTNSKLQQAAVISGAKGSVSVPAGVDTAVSGAYNSQNQFSPQDVAKLPTSPKLECLTGAKGDQKGVMVEGVCVTLDSLRGVNVLGTGNPDTNPAAQLICNDWVRVWYWTVVWGTPVYTFYWFCDDWVMGGTTHSGV